MPESLLDLVLNKEYLAAWSVLMFFFVSAWLFKQPYIHIRVIKHSIAGLIITLIPIILTEIFGRHNGVIAAVISFPIIFLTAFSSVILLPHEALILLWLRKKQKNGRQVLSITFVNKHYRYYFSDRGRFRFLRQTIKHLEK